MKKYELYVLVGKAMENTGVDKDIIKGMAFDSKAIIKANLDQEIDREADRVIDLLEGLCSNDHSTVKFWIGVALKTLANLGKE